MMGEDSLRAGRMSPLLENGMGIERQNLVLRGCGDCMRVGEGFGERVFGVTKKDSLGFCDDWEGSFDLARECKPEL